MLALTAYHNVSSLLGRRSLQAVELNDADTIPLEHKDRLGAENNYGPHCDAPQVGVELVHHPGVVVLLDDVCDTLVALPAQCTGREAKVQRCGNCY